MAYISCCTNILSKYSYLTGRKGAILDDDLFSLCAVNEGLSYGIFPEHSLKHLIDPFRIKLSYLSELACDHGYLHAHYARFCGKSLSNPIRIGSAKAASMLFLKGRLKLAIEESRHFIQYLKQSKYQRTLRASKS